MLKMINLVLTEAEAAGDHTFVIAAPSTELSLGLCAAAEAQGVLYSVFCHGENLKTQISSVFLKHVCCEKWRQRVIFTGSLVQGHCSHSVHVSSLWCRKSPF